MKLKVSMENFEKAKKNVLDFQQVYRNYQNTLTQKKEELKNMGQENTPYANATYEALRRELESARLDSKVQFAESLDAFKKDVARAGTPDGNMINEGATLLLEKGLVEHPEELRFIAGQYDGNIAMLRIITRYANEHGWNKDGDFNDLAQTDFSIYKHCIEKFADMAQAAMNDPDGYCAMYINKHSALSEYNSDDE